MWVKETSEQVYPNAEILVPEVEYKFWTDPALVEKVPEGFSPLVRRIQATFPNWKNIKQFADGGGCSRRSRRCNAGTHRRTHVFPSHSGGQQLFIQGDVTGIQLFVTNPGWHLMFDGDPIKAEANRRAFYDRVIAEKAMIVGYHFGFLNVGMLAKDGNGYAFEPIKVEFATGAAAQLAAPPHLVTTTTRIPRL